MDAKNYSQLELFMQAKDYAGPKPKDGNSFFNFIYGHEKIILVVIGFIIIGAVSFCVGVEKGKKLSLTRTASPAPQAINPPVSKIIPQADVPETKTPLPQAVQSPVESAVVKKDDAPAAGGYTIQVGTYQSRTYAGKEAEALKKKGFSSMILSSKNGYSLVCIGNFRSKEKAKTLLTELKKRYQGCFIRRL